MRVPPADTAVWAAGSAGSCRPNGLAAASATRRVADPGRADISDTVIRSFERLGWATMMRRPTRLDSCRSASRQPGEIR